MRREYNGPCSIPCAAARTSGIGHNPWRPSGYFDSSEFSSREERDGMTVRRPEGKYRVVSPVRNLRRRSALRRLREDLENSLQLSGICQCLAIRRPRWERLQAAARSHRRKAQRVQRSARAVAQRVRRQEAHQQGEDDGDRRQHARRQGLEGLSPIAHGKPRDDQVDQGSYEKCAEENDQRHPGHRKVEQPVDHVLPLKNAPLFAFEFKGSHRPPYDAPASRQIIRFAESPREIFLR